MEKDPFYSAAVRAYIFFIEWLIGVAASSLLQIRGDSNSFPLILKSPLFETLYLDDVHIELHLAFSILHFKWIHVKVRKYIYNNK